MSQGRAGRRGERREQAIRQIERAMLELSGERGYANVTIDAVLERSGSNRHRFYSAFSGKEACFQSAYRAATERLVGRISGRCAPDLPWERGVRGALEELATFVAAEPDLARGIFAEAGTHGGRVAGSRSDALSRLTNLVDRGRDGVPPDRTQPPGSAAAFIVGAVEAAVLKSFSESGEADLREDLADLLYTAVDLFRGPEAAQGEVRSFLSRGGR